MKIHSDHTNENKQSYNFGTDIARNQAQSLAFGRDTKAGKAWESFIVEKREGFRFALIGECCARMLGMAS